MQTENTYVETDLGNIALNPRGEYLDEASYEYLDIVSYKGGSYMCLAELTKTVSGIAPVQSKNTEHWQMLTLPGGLTSDYITMHDDVVNKAKQVETSRAAAELSQQEVEAAQADVSQMRQDTQEAAEEAASSRDSAAGYAQSAEASRTAAKESEDNINAQVVGFDAHVAEKTSAAEISITEARRAAVSAVSTKQDNATQAVTDEGNKQIKNVEDAGTEQVGKAKSAGASAVSAADAAGVSAVNTVKTQQTASIKAVADEGTQQVTAVNTAGSTQASIIETKGADQVKAIQEAGENALQNISDGVDKGLSEEGKAADAKATGEAISNLTEDLDNVYNTTELTPVPTNKITPTEILDKSVYYNSTYGLLGFTNNGDNLKCNIYPIIKGKSYYLRGNGKNHEGCPVAIFAESYVSDGTTKYKEVVSGESEKLHNIKKSFKASYDGYIYINCINESDGLFNVEYVSNIQKINNSLKNELDCKLSLYGEFQLVESTIINNKVFNINKLTEQNQSDGCYMREKINNDDDIIRVSGYSYSSNISYPLIAFFDEYDNIIEYYGDASTLYSDKIFKIPYRTNYIIVNGKTSNIKVEKFILKNNLTETVESLKKQTTFANIKSVEKQNEKYEIKNIKISDFEIIQNKLYTFAAKMDESDRYSTVLLKFNLELNSIKILYGAGVYGGAFLDKDKKYISSINAGTLDVVVTVPQDTTYIAYTYSNGMTDFEIGVLYNIYESKQFTVPGISHFLNPWENKKIVLLGTSVGFGSNATTSYIYEASKYLGFNFVNTSVPGLAIHTESDGRPLIYGSSSLSVSEYASNGKILSTAPVDYVPGGKYNTYYQSYERIFTDKNADADLWLYAVAPNNDNFDLKDWNDFNKSSWKYNDESGFDEHRTTFIGALLFLMNKMYELNPNARMAFVLDSAFAYGDSQGGGNIKTVANYWGIPVIDLWGKINRSPKSLEVIKSKNGTDSHPSTFGHEKMGMMMVGELLRIG